ncbi:hypothetical protein HHL28_16830 [Aerophototrophica crusticola]|uniref:Peptidase A2 domain-containing protein n=1 Tax=Aerophototrophica crusticola TaxID=1709002 RepID=A0A858RAX4_9PROT|nr:hypothetical protein HHL28_16830 [Rhodospirillaceae bacterium B3]
MTAVNQGLFLTYASGGGGVLKAYDFNVSFDGGKTQHLLLMDTGSPWMNVGSNLLPEGTYTVCDPQPNTPAPNYSSDGNQYEGQWVQVTATVTGGNGASFTTPAPITVFRSTSSPGVSMMGVSTRFADLDAMNVFLNVPGIVNGSYPAGYILDQYGVWFGYGQDTLAQFTQAPVTSALGQRTAAAQVTLTGPGLPTYTATVPFLMDTGIDYTIVTPNTNPPAEPPPSPTAWQEPNPNGGFQFIPGVGVSVTVGGMSWGFNMDQCGKQASVPAFARLAKPSANGIVNTGRHFLASYKYLVQLDSRIGSATGTMGFLKV